MRSGIQFGASKNGAVTRGRRISPAKTAFTALAAATAFAIAIAGFGPVSTARAVGGDRSSASGTFLSGTLLGSLLPAELARIGTAAAANPGGAPTQTERDALDATVLDALNIDIGGGLQIPVNLADVGALSSFARAQDGATSQGASGLVTNDGGVGVGAVGAGEVNSPLTLDLSDIIGGTLANELANLNLELGAVSASATSTGGATPQGSYEIVGSRLLITSNTLAGVTTSVTNLITPLQSAVNGLGGATGTISTTVGGLTGALGTLSPADVSVVVNGNLQAAVAPLLTGTLGAGTAVSINLATGTIAVDLQQIAGSLNGRPANSPLLTPAVITAITTGVTNLIASYTTTLQNTITAALNAVTINGNIVIRVPVLGTEAARVTIQGTLGQILGGGGTVTIVAAGITLPLSGVLRTLLVPLLNGVVSPTTGSLGTLITGIQNQVITPVANVTGPALGLVNSLIGITINNQTPTPAVAGSQFTETALRLSLLPQGPIPQLLELNVAEAAVGPNALNAPSAISSVTPVRGPTTGGTPVTITGTGFTSATAVTFDGTDGTAFTVVSDTSITVTSPAHAAGPVPLVVVDPAGNSAPTTFTYVAPPTVTAINPVQGPTAGGTVVNITGTGFTAATGVTFDGIAGTAFVVNSPTSITVTSPAHAVGPVDVVVTGEFSPSAPATYTYVTAPVVASLSPTSGPTAGGTVVTIAGSGFTGSTGVLFGGVPATSFTVNSATSITATSPAHAVGPVDVVVQHPGGDSAPQTFTYLAAPTISSLTPTQGTTLGGTEVTITGSGFTGATAVTFGGSAAAFTVVSPTTITATTPAHAAGTVEVVVSTAGGSSLPGDFTFVAPPALSGIDPVSGPTAGGTPVTLTGSGFLPGSTVDFGGAPGTDVTVVNSTTITVTSPAHASGATPVTVTTPFGTSGPQTFTFLAPGVPFADFLDPDNGPTAGGNPVTVFGSNFVPLISQVSIDGALVVAFPVPGGIQFVAPPHAAGTVQVVVVTPGFADTLPLDYTYIDAPPTVTGLTPGTGTTIGGTEVTITGTDLEGTTDVTFGGVPATIVGTPTATTVTVLTPAHSAGTVDVVLTGGSLPVDAGDFIFVAPTITTVNPGDGPTAGGTTVTVTGTDFENATGVSFGGTVVPIPLGANTGTVITVASPPHAAGPVEVRVQFATGSSEPGAFEFIPPAAITGIAPVRGPIAGGTPVTITGTGFTAATGVTFGEVAGSAFTVNSDTSITVNTPAHAAGSVGVVVVSPGGDSAPGDFEFVAPLTASSLNPDAGPVAGGTVVVITGTGFDDATGVTFDGLPGTAFAVTSPTSITVTSPVHPTPGIVDVVVEGDFGNAGPLDFEYFVAPTITLVDPTEGPVIGGTVVTITGSGFTGATSVTFGGIAGSDLDVISDTELEITSPAHAAGPVDVVVEGVNAPSNAGAFTFVASPVIIGLNPTSGPTAGGNTVIITGTGFTGATDVTFGGVPATTVTVDSDTQITVVAPPHAVADVEVVVEHPIGNSAPVDYAYLAAPTITTVAPPTGPITGGTAVTITGTGFTGATGVTFDGVAGTQLLVVDPTTITVVTPPHALGSVPVVVQSPNGDSAAGAFEYVPVPVSITTLTPDNGGIGGGTVVTITGTNLGGATGVTFDGIPGTDLIVTSDTSVTITSPPHAVGPVDVVVQTTTVPSAPATFVYRVLTVITEITPPGGPTAGGTTVTITGACFTGATGVFFGTTAATSFTVVSDTQITAVSPAGTGVQDVTVVGSPVCGTQVLASAFTYGDPATPAAVGNGTGSLSYTGMDALPWILAGALILLLGIPLILIGRRRRGSEG